MRIAVVAPTYLPARRANTIQVMKMAQAMTTLGHDVRVFVPGISPSDSSGNWDEIAHHYGLRHQFEIEWVPTHPYLRRYDFGFSSVKFARQWGAELLYTRLPQAAAVASILGMSAIYEVHDIPGGMLNPWLLTRFLKGSGARGLVVITSALKDALTPWINHKLSLPVLIAPDGVDLARYDNLPVSADARQSIDSSFQISPSAFVAGYTGHLYPGRGAQLILDIAARIPEITFIFVGGEPDDLEHFRALSKTCGLENVILTGFISNADLPRYQVACDILLMPYQKRVAASSGGDIARFLSPMKVFEYLACGRVILSSDLPVLREVLNEKNAILLAPGNVDAWVEAIRGVQAEPQKWQALADQAQQDAQVYSWESRAARLLAIVN